MSGMTFSFCSAALVHSFFILSIFEPWCVAFFSEMKRIVTNQNHKLKRLRINKNGWIEQHFTTNLHVICDFYWQFCPALIYSIILDLRCENSIALLLSFIGAIKSLDFTLGFWCGKSFTFFWTCVGQQPEIWHYIVHDQRICSTVTHDRNTIN